VTGILQNIHIIHIAYASLVPIVHYWATWNKSKEWVRSTKIKQVVVMVVVVMV